MQAVTIASAITLSCLAQRDFEIGDWMQYIIVAVVVFGGFIAQGLKKIIEAVNEKKAKSSPPDRLERPGPMSRSPESPMLKPIPPRIRRSPPVPTARPTPPQPVARPVPPRPPTPAARPQQGRAATPVLIGDDEPWQAVQREALPSAAAKLGTPRKKPQKALGESMDRFDPLHHPEDHLGHLDPEAHLGHENEPVGSAEEEEKKRTRRPRKKAGLAAALTGEGLRRAIVMSEILNPPLALRDDTNRDPWAG